MSDDFDDFDPTEPFSEDEFVTHSRKELAKLDRGEDIDGDDFDDDDE